MPTLADGQSSLQAPTRLCCASPPQAKLKDQCDSCYVCETGDQTKVLICSSFYQECSDHAKVPSMIPAGYPEATFAAYTTPDDPSQVTSINCSFDGKVDKDSVKEDETDPERFLKMDGSLAGLGQYTVDNEIEKQRRPRRKKTKSTTIGRFELSREYFTSSPTTPGDGSQNVSDHAQSQNGLSRDMDRETNKRKDEWLRMFDFSMTRYESPSSLSTHELGGGYLEPSGSDVAGPHVDVPNLSSGRGYSNNTAWTTAQATTAPVAIPRPFSQRINSSVESSWTADEHAPSPESIGSTDLQAPNNSYDRFGSSSSSVAVSSYFSMTPRPLIDFDEVVASRIPDWIRRRQAFVSPTESTSSSSSPTPDRPSSLEFSESSEPSWHAFDFDFRPSVRLMPVEAEVSTLDEKTQLASSSGGCLPELSVSLIDGRLNSVSLVAQTPSSLISSQRYPKGLGARHEETTDLPLWSYSPLTLSHCLTSRSNSFSSATMTTTAISIETSATAAATVELSSRTMTSSLAQALATLTSSAAVASAEEDTPSERVMPYGAPTSQPKLRSVRARVPVVTHVREELHPEFAVAMEGMTPRSDV